MVTRMSHVFDLEAALQLIIGGLTDCKTLSSESHIVDVHRNHQLQLRRLRNR